MWRKYTSNVLDWSAAMKVGPCPIFMLTSWAYLWASRNSYRTETSSETYMFVLFGSVNEVNEKLGILRTMIPISTISRPVEIGLRLTGIWPNSLVLFRMLWTLVMGIVLIFQYHYLLIHFSTEELPNLIDGLSTTLPYNLLFIKLIVLWVNNRYVPPTTL